MPPLENLRLAMLVVHVIDLAAVIGPFLLQSTARHVPSLRLMLAGAAAQIVSGNALIASRMLQGLDVDEAKMFVKLALGATVADPGTALVALVALATVIGVYFFAPLLIGEVARLRTLLLAARV